jgi:hypothetical protein
LPNRFSKPTQPAGKVDETPTKTAPAVLTRAILFSEVEIFQIDLAFNFRDIAQCSAIIPT